MVEEEKTGDVGAERRYYYGVVAASILHTAVDKEGRTGDGETGNIKKETEWNGEERREKLEGPAKQVEQLKRHILGGEPREGVKWK